MKKEEWQKVKRYLGCYGNKSACPICNKEITEDCEGEGVTYSKTRAGSHLFIHEKCLRQGEKDHGKTK